jgi:hypothetical protein
VHAAPWREWRRGALCQMVYGQSAKRCFRPEREMCAYAECRWARLTPIGGTPGTLWVARPTLRDFGSRAAMCAQGERRAGERRAGERRAESGERRAESGERRAESGERCAVPAALTPSENHTFHFFQQPPHIAAHPLMELSAIGRQAALGMNVPTRRQRSVVEPCAVPKRANARLTGTERLSSYRPNGRCQTFFFVKKLRAVFSTSP